MNHIAPRQQKTISKERDHEKKGCDPLHRYNSYDVGRDICPLPGWLIQARLTGSAETKKLRLVQGFFVFGVVQFIYMKFIVLVIGGFILLMIVNKFLGGSPI